MFVGKEATTACDWVGHMLDHLPGVEREEGAGSQGAGISSSGSGHFVLLSSTSPISARAKSISSAVYASPNSRLMALSAASAGSVRRPPAPVAWSKIHT